MPDTRPTADRNLLFGVLALQMDFVSRDQLVAAMNAWALDKSRSLGDLLVEQGVLSSKRLTLLEALVEEHLGQHDHDPEKSLAAVSGSGGLRTKLEELTDPEHRHTLTVQVGDPGDPTPRDLTLAYQPPAAPVGRFVVLRPYARGGLGEVFVARDEELHREVALKEIQRRHADDAASRSRFLLEAEITGRLEHPGIVPVYGFGTHADGRPYYAMRLIQGESLKQAIKDFHDGSPRRPGERWLRLRKLLGSFLAVCHAIHYAHSRGVIHRDLKPDNIMLGKFGETLVLDWGLAKTLDHREEFSSLAEPSLHPATHHDSMTLHGVAIGTPGYMSPEQAAGRLDQLTPASDVYSLGATLYCLLTGRAPFVGSDVTELLRRIQKGDILPPRVVDPRVPPALEAICLKALALEPRDRYASARDLAEDLEHWLADEPVRAYPEPLRQRAARWARQHRALVSAAGALLAAGILGLAVGVVVLGQANRRTEEQRQLAQSNFEEAEEQRRRAEEHLAKAQVAEAAAKQSAAEAEAVNRFLLNDLLAEARPDRNARARQVTIEELLGQAARGVVRAFPDQPGVEAAVRQTLGNTYGRLGQYGEAEAHLRQAVRLRQKLRGDSHPETLSAVNSLGWLLQEQNKLTEAEALFRHNLEMAQAVLGAEHALTLTTVNNLAAVLLAAGKPAEAEPLFRASLEAHDRLHGPEHAETLTVKNNLGLTMRALGRAPEAEALFRQVLEARKRHQGPEHPSTLNAMNNLALALGDQRKRTEAEPLLRQALEGSRRVEGPVHPRTLNAANSLAALLLEQGKAAEAEPLLRQNLETCRRELGPENVHTVRALNNLAALLQGQGKWADAEALFRQALELNQRAHGPDHRESLQALTNLALTLQVQSKWADAEPLLRQAVETARRTLGPDHAETLAAATDLAWALEQQGKRTAAEEILRDVVGRRRALPGSQAELARTLAQLGNVLLGAGRPADAEPVLRECLETRQRVLPPGDGQTAMAQCLLGESLLGQKQFAGAEPLLLAGHEGLRQARGVPPQRIEEARERLARLYEAWGKPEQAATWKGKGKD